MKTIQDILKLSSDFLLKKGIEHPKRQAEEVIADALNIKRMQLYLEYDRPLNSLELDLCRKNLARRGDGEPAAYIRGFVEFAGCKILLTKDVLIPRQETEILVENISQELGKRNLEGAVLWDICCGSGCIGISLKKRFPQLNVVCSDLSPKALVIAAQSAKENQVDVTFLQGDFLEPFQRKKVDYITCNPPYISEKEYEELSREVRDFEPSLALIAGPDGLDFYKRLQQDLADHLNPNALAWLEIGWQQGKAVKELFIPPIWKSCRLEQDWAGHDRFISLEIE